jgi:hypothetical protein
VHVTQGALRVATLPLVDPPAAPDAAITAAVVVGCDDELDTDAADAIVAAVAAPELVSLLGVCEQCCKRTIVDNEVENLRQ